MQVAAEGYVPVTWHYPGKAAQIASEASFEGSPRASLTYMTLRSLL